ncbi:mechanosensitive ion channel domain-containing protein [Flavicella sp.]|uniref:mechanosensitive ion channel family protein n=1 Tax=Flavicella sp. TaxID=2957742 RepID=UPI003017CD5B
MNELENLTKNINKFDYGIFIEFAFKYGVQILIGLLILIIGLWIIKKLAKVINAVMAKAKLDASLVQFLSNLITWTLKIVLFISVLNQFGIATTSFMAIIGAAGLAVGLALQGSFSNFAGGILILLFKPFKVGDFIDAQGEKGDVKEIQIFVTKLITLEGRVAIIPNGILSNGTIKNYTDEGKLRVDIAIGISYDSDIKQARNILMEVLENHPLTLKDPAPRILVTDLGDSSVNLGLRPWSKPKDYWTVYFDCIESCKEALDKANITIPFPQRDVHVISK